VLKKGYLAIFAFSLLLICGLQVHLAMSLSGKGHESRIIYQGPQPEHLEAIITAYTNRPQETNSDPTHTATMEKPKAGWTCAVSRDLIHWLGGRVYIEGMGVRRVNDLMNERFSKRVDIFIGTVKEARAFGVQNRKVIFLGR